MTLSSVHSSLPLPLPLFHPLTTVMLYSPDGERLGVGEDGPGQEVAQNLPTVPLHAVPPRPVSGVQAPRDVEVILGAGPLTVHGHRHTGVLYPCMASKTYSFKDCAMRWLGKNSFVLVCGLDFRKSCAAVYLIRTERKEEFKIRCGFRLVLIVVLHRVLIS